MMTPTAGPVDAPPVSVRSEVADRMWVLIVAGVTTGVLVVGVGSRLAMLLLRLTSPEWVVGVRSDDGFEIGRVTLSGSYNLLLLGATVGVIGAAAYRAVAPWLLGPVWFRRTTVAAGSGAVVGSMLVHADGIDFRLLQPVWLAVGLFVALPALFGVAIAFAVDRVSAKVAAPGWRRWLVPIVLVVSFPPTVFVLGVATIVLVVWVPLRRALESVGGPPMAVGVGVRAVWLSVAVLGLVALVTDVRALA